MTTFSTDRTLGVEFEAFNVCRLDLVTELRRKGISAELAYYSGSNFSVWQIKTDGSINGPQGFEVVSPVLRGAEALRQIKIVLETMNELGAKVNRSCGFHVHWGVGDWGIKQFRNLCKRWMKFEEALDLIQPPSRRGCINTYLQNFRPWGETLQTCFGKVDVCRNISQLQRIFQGGSAGRYKKLNFAKYQHTGTVEFRHHSGTTDYDKVVNWLMLTNSMLADADNNKSIKTGQNDQTPKQKLTVMLGAAVRTGGITSEIRKYYTSRQRKFEREERS